MSWQGPYQIRDLLERDIDTDLPSPPEDAGVYVVTRQKWEGQPRPDDALYVGGITGKSERFGTRIGDLIADMFGFYGGETGHHSGGQTIRQWCKDNHKKPIELYIGWEIGVTCKRCAEIEAYDDLQPTCNKKRPSRCKLHC